MSRKPAVLVLVFSLCAVSCAKRPVVHADAQFDGKLVLREPAALILSEQVDAKAVVQDLLANFEGHPEQAVQLLREELSGVLSGQGACNVGRSELGGAGSRLFGFHPIDTTARRDSLLACIEFSSDEYGVMRASVADPERLAGLLSAEGLRHLVLIERLTLDRGMVDRGSVLTGSAPMAEATLSGQVLIWSTRTRSFAYNGYVTGTRTTKRVGRSEIRDLACFFAQDLYTALR